MPISWTAKDPDEEYEYTHDWGPRLLVNGVDEGDTIFLPDEVDLTKRPTTELAEGDVVVSEIVAIPASQKLQYWVREGTVKSKITATVHTVQGRTFQETFVLPIKER